MFWLPLGRVTQLNDWGVPWAGSGGQASGDCELNGWLGTLFTVVTVNGCLMMRYCGLKFGSQWDGAERWMHRQKKSLTYLKCGSSVRLRVRRLGLSVN